MFTSDGGLFCIPAGVWQCFSRRLARVERGSKALDAHPNDGVALRGSIVR